MKQLELYTICAASHYVPYRINHILLRLTGQAYYHMNYNVNSQFSESVHRLIIHTYVITPVDELCCPVICCLEAKFYPHRFNSYYIFYHIYDLRAKAVRSGGYRYSRNVIPSCSRQKLFAQSIDITVCICI